MDQLELPGILSACPAVREACAKFGVEIVKEVVDMCAEHGTDVVKSIVDEKSEAVDVAATQAEERAVEDVETTVVETEDDETEDEDDTPATFKKKMTRKESANLVDQIYARLVEVGTEGEAAAKTAALLGVKRVQASQALRKLVKSGMVAMTGKLRGAKYSAFFG